MAEVPRKHGSHREGAVTYQVVQTEEGLEKWKGESVPPRKKWQSQGEGGSKGTHRGIKKGAVYAKGTDICPEWNKNGGLWDGCRKLSR